MKRHTSFYFVLALLCLAGTAWSLGAPATSTAAASLPTTLSSPTLPWLSQATPSAEVPGLSRSDLSSAPTLNFLSGYCSLDCSRCSSNQVCQSRHAGICTSVPSC
jgi:hypothetical protein